jgi:hypothetical protein
VAASRFWDGGIDRTRDKPGPLPEPLIIGRARGWHFRVANGALRTRTRDYLISSSVTTTAAKQPSASFRISPRVGRSAISAEIMADRVETHMHVNTRWLRLAHDGRVLSGVGEIAHGACIAFGIRLSVAHCR